MFYAKSRSLVLFFLVALLVATLLPTSPSPAVAQDLEDCPQGLTPVDCVILANYLRAMNEIDSVAIQRLAFIASITLFDQELGISANTFGAVTFAEGNLFNPSAADMTLEFSSVGFGADTPITIPYRLINNALYLDFENQGWVRFGLLSIPGGSFTVQTLFETLTALGKNNLVEWSRDEDITLNGEDLAVFTVEVPLDFLAVPLAVGQVILEILSLFPDFNIRAGTETLAIAALLAEGTSVTVTQTISQDDFTLRGLRMEITTDIAAAVLGEEVDPQFEDLLPRTSLNLRIEGQFKTYNAPVEIEAPDSWRTGSELALETLSELFSAFLQMVGADSAVPEPMMP